MSYSGTQSSTPATGTANEVFGREIHLEKKRSIQAGKVYDLTIQIGVDTNKYDWDGEVVTLQEGKGRLDLVLMGDGFIKEDFDNGTYESIMKQAYEEFLSIEPFTTLKDGFNVFYVKTPSPERILAINTGSNGAVNTGHITKFSTTFTSNSTSIEGDDGLVREYALKAFKSDAEERIKDATIVVIANQECRVGTCVNSWYIKASQAVRAYQAYASDPSLVYVAEHLAPAPRALSVGLL